MAADRRVPATARVQTVVGTADELAALLGAQAGRIVPLSRPWPTRDGRWCLRVCLVDQPATVTRPARRRPAVVAGVVSGVSVALAGVTAALWWLLDQVVAHWPVVVGVAVVVGWVWVKVKRPAGKGGG